jgi:type IV pilus assembly protein PilY1
MRVLTANPITWETDNDGDAGQNPDPSASTANHAGWYFDLPLPKERVVRDLLIRGGKVIFITTIPSASACSAGGESILHEVDACSGGRLTTPQFDINGDGVIDANDLIIIPGFPGGVAPTGLWFPRMLYTPPILPAGDDLEVKMVADATGNITPIWEASEPVGIFYWLQFGQ